MSFSLNIPNVQFGNVYKPFHIGKVPQPFKGEWAEISDWHWTHPKYTADEIAADVKENGGAAYLLNGSRRLLERQRNLPLNNSPLIVTGPDYVELQQCDDKQALALLKKWFATTGSPLNDGATITPTALDTVI